MQFAEEKRVRVWTRRRRGGRGKRLTLKIERSGMEVKSIPPHIHMSEETALGGIINMGLTCYANSVIQCFRHCPKLSWMFKETNYKRFFQSDPVKTRDAQQRLCESFGDVIQLLEKCRKGQSVRPTDFWIKFRTAVQDTGFEHLTVRIPHDSHEFYLCLLDIVHEALAQSVEMRILKAEPRTEEERRCIQALDTWKKEFESKYSPLVDLFYGLAHVVIECKGCGNKTHRWETFTSIKGVISEGAATPSLQEMIREELKPEVIPGYDCDKCRPNKQDAMRTVRLWRLPLYLTVVIKRFTPNGRKINKPMSPLSDEPVNFQEFFSEESPEYDGNLKYNLLGIVDHHGGAGGGHYTAQCKKIGSDNWHVYDDESSHSIPNPMFGGSTYMLWFSRADA